MSLNPGPDEDGGQDDPATVGAGVLVVSSGQGPPLLDQAVAAFDDVAALVLVGVQGDRAATSRASALAVAGLGGGCGDHRLDAPPAQQSPVAARGVRLVRPQQDRTGPRPPRSAA